MSRNVVAQRTPDRSFAGLMDHLTGYVREDVSDTDSEFGAIFRRSSKPDSAPTDESLTNARNGARSMLPVTERKPLRSGTSSDAAELSYEAALRMHGRRGSPAAAATGVPKSPGQPGPPGSRPVVSPRNDAASIPKKADVSGKRSPRPQQFGQSADRTAGSTARHGTKPVARDPQAEALRGASRVKEAPAVSASRIRKSSASQAKPRAGGTGVAATTSTTTSKAKASRGKPAKKCAAEKPSGRDSGAAGAAYRNHRALPEDFGSVADELAAEIAPVDAGRMRADAEFAESQLELLQPLGQLDQRRTIVSVRLTEGEFSCLRERAEESGISVSAYMRSCVVDADQLRAQVKRALAEMRALSVTPEMAQIAGRIPALGASSQSNGHGSLRNDGWFRLVLRPLAFLFGPLFPPRPSA